MREAAGAGAGGGREGGREGERDGRTTVPGPMPSNSSNSAKTVSSGIVDVMVTVLAIQDTTRWRELIDTCT